MAEDLKAEHARLMEQTRALQREHDALADEPVVDWPAHEAHKQRLREKIEELRAHLRRLEREGTSRDR
jgi:prefoldin subunit 5